MSVIVFAVCSMYLAVFFSRQQRKSLELAVEKMATTAAANKKRAPVRRGKTVDVDNWQDLDLDDFEVCEKPGIPQACPAPDTATDIDL